MLTMPAGTVESPVAVVSDTLVGRAWSALVETFLTQCRSGRAACARAAERATTKVGPELVTEGGPRERITFAVLVPFQVRKHFRNVNELSQL